MSRILNAAPQSVQLGTDDQSIRALLPEDPIIPQHLPLVYFMGGQGTIEKQLTGGPELVKLYGSSLFDKSKKYYNHAVRFLEKFTGKANAVMTQRLVPDDAKRASAALYMDVIEADVPNYLRNEDGSLKLDGVGDPVINANEPYVTGYDISYFVEQLQVDYAKGSLTTKNGHKSKDDNGTTVTSTAIPVAEFTSSSFGEIYKQVALLIKTMSPEDMDPKVVEATKSLTYKLSLYKPSTDGTSSVTRRTLAGAPDAVFSFKEKAYSPTTEQFIDLVTVVNSQWFNSKDKLKPIAYNDFDITYVYNDLLKTKLEELVVKTMTAMKDSTDVWDPDWFDFVYGPYTTDAEFTDMAKENAYLLNFLTLKSTSKVPYLGLSLNNQYNDTTITYETPDGTFIPYNAANGDKVKLSGGSDGTVDNSTFEALVRKEMDKYLDANSVVMDTAVNKETILYDSGFTLDTKKALCNFIGVRKNTCLILSTHDDALGEKYLGLSDSQAVGSVLKTRLKLNPESLYFGTGVARAVVIVGAGLIPGDTSNTRIPLSYTLAGKLSAMMGAGDYKWKDEFSFDTYPGNGVNDLIDIQPAFIPNGIKPSLWNDGLVWAQPYDRQQFQLPGVQTVYDNDTSVLNTVYTMMAVCTLSSIADDAWRNFTGESKLTPNQFADALVAYVNRRVKDIFAGRFVVIPEVEFTDQDKRRGYSWRLINKLYGNNAKTVGVYSTEVYRMSDLNK